MRLLLIRHAESTANVRKALDTALPGPPLTELGDEQAAELAQRLASEPIVGVYASRATRARQTAGPLAAAFGLEVNVVDGAQEVSVGTLEGRTDREALRTYAQVVRPWMRGKLDVAMPGGETGAQIQARFVAVAGELRAKHEQADPDGVVALISHGGVIRLGAEWLAGNVRPEVADSGLLPNTAMVALETRDGARWHCLDWAGTPM